jgi:flagella basal body P-ring formation protein FlgA
MSIPLVLLAAEVPRAAAAPPCCALLAEAQVAGDSVYLSDLLPSQAPARLRDWAGKVWLSSAPAPGESLELAGQRISGALPAAARADLTVPAEVLVRRLARALNRGEVLSALQQALRANRFPGASNLEIDDLQFSAPVRVAAADARLEVREADFDPALDRARFLLASKADPRSLPFMVTARLKQPDQGPGSAPAAGSALLRGGALFARPEVATAPLVEPNRPARLHLVSNGMEMTLAVRPLERGGLHQTVRVRLEGSGKVLRGVVAAPGYLEGQF